MRKSINGWIVEAILLVVYKSILEFFFMPVYFGVFSYMLNVNYQFDLNKWMISEILLAIMIVLLFRAFSSSNSIYSIFIIMIYDVCIIPMLAVYSCVTIAKIEMIIYPFIFWALMILILNHYINDEDNYCSKIKIPSFGIRGTNYFVLGCCFFFTIVCWAWAGFPILTSLADSTAQRLALRANAMPRLLSYIFMILGGVVMPYLFARYLSKGKKFCALLSFISGFLLFSINGMKTWIFLYLFVVGIYLVCKIGGYSSNKICILITGALCAVSALCIVLYLKFGALDYMNQFGRVVLIPNDIGFKSINFFKDNELLYLRESILRAFFDTPYEGGSDFYINYGANSSINSSRSNNGLWGDAFRNFGFLGMIIYPVLFGKIFRMIAGNGKYQNKDLQIFTMFLMLWNSVNISFFTWLLTGGVIVIIILEKLFKPEDLQDYVEYDLENI